MTTLRQLEARFLRIRDSHHYDHVESISEADGVVFVCPKCFAEGGNRREGVHSVICWKPSVSPTISPGPGRWDLSGTGIDDLTLVAGSSSVLLTRGCHAHFFVRNGHIENC